MVLILDQYLKTSSGMLYRVQECLHAPSLDFSVPLGAWTVLAISTLWYQVKQMSSQESRGQGTIK